MRDKIHSKKGFAIQFNWVFIMIAGGLILLFFFSVIRGCSKSGQESIETEVKIALDSVIGSAEKSDGTLFRVGIKDTKLAFECPYLRVGEIGAQILLDTAFGPTRLEAIQDEYFVMALDWNVPYKILNFLYFSSPDIRYIFKDDPDLMYEKILYDPYHYTIPENMTPEHVAGCAGLTDEADYKVRFIFFDFIDDSCGQPFENMPAQDVTALLINRQTEGFDDDPLGGWGTVNFYQYQESTHSFVEMPGSNQPYLGRSMLIGAIFTEDPYSYACTMQNALNRYNLVTKIYYNRTKAFSNNPAYSNVCNDRTAYANSVPLLQELVDKTLDNKPAHNDGPKISEIYARARRLQDFNAQAVRGSCPLIY